MFILTSKHLYELNMRTENFSQILYLLQTLWFKAINSSFIHTAHSNWMCQHQNDSISISKFMYKNKVGCQWLVFIHVSYMVTSSI